MPSASYQTGPVMYRNLQCSTGY